MAQNHHSERAPSASFSRLRPSEKRLRQSEIPTDAATHPTTTIEAVPCNTPTVSKAEVNYPSVAQTAGFLGEAINPPPNVTRI